MTTLRQRIKEVGRHGIRPDIIDRERAALYPALVAALEEMEEALRDIQTFYVYLDSRIPPNSGRGAKQALDQVHAALRAMDEEV